MPWVFFRFCYQVLYKEQLLQLVYFLDHLLFWNAFLRNENHLCLLLFKVIKALLARSAILFVYLPGWHYETSVLRVRQTKKRTNISVMLANIYLLLSFLLSKFSFSCLRLRFHLCFIFTLTNKKTSVFRIILLVFPRFYTVVVILKT